MSVNYILKQYRRFFRALVSKLLPSFISDKLIRNTLNLSVPAQNSTLRFEVASNLQDLKAALSLLQDNFEKEGYAEKTATGVRLTPYHLLPETVVIVAKEHGRVIATISVVPRTEFGVPLDSSFELQNFLKNESRVVEVSSLAVDATAAGHRGEVLYNLMKYMYHCNVDVLGAELEVIGVNPKMVPLYKAILLFQSIPETQSKEYSFVNGAPVIPMSFDLRTATNEYGKVYGKRPAHLNLLSFFKLPPPSHFYLPKRSELIEKLPQGQALALKEILSWQPDILKKLSGTQKRALQDLYAGKPEILAVLIERGLHA